MLELLHDANLFTTFTSADDRDVGITKLEDCAHARKISASSKSMYRGFS